MLEVKNISKYYGAKMAIEHISFSAETGQVVGLLGHNGCGKSTTMSIITGCQAPTEGEVYIDGVSVMDQPLKAKKNIGYLPEIPPVYPDMTVNEQLKFACGLREIPAGEHEKQITRACEDLNITGVRNRLIHNLSKGYQQRVGFAQALIGRPGLLVLDEPTVGLDPQQIIELRELITRLKRDHTILISSHILPEIAATCDRVVVLSNGHLTADDTIDGLLKHADSKRTVLLQADGDSDKLVKLIERLPGVESCTVQFSGFNGQTEYKIKTEEGADICRDLFDALASEGCPIRLLRPEQASLEDVFLQLTQDHRYAMQGKEL